MTITEDLGSVSELKKSPGEGNDNSLQHYFWENQWPEEPG